MKIAIPLQNDSADAQIDVRFGRCSCFGIYDVAADSWKFIDNAQDLQAAQGAGIQSANTVAGADANVVIAVNLGPKAMRVLQATGAKIYQAPNTVTAKAAVELFNDNQLQEITQANVEGHWV